MQGYNLKPLSKRNKEAVKLFISNSKKGDISDKIATLKVLKRIDEEKFKSAFHMLKNKK